jgi:hypothetical protein
LVMALSPSSWMTTITLMPAGFVPRLTEEGDTVSGWGIVEWDLHNTVMFNRS